MGMSGAAYLNQLAEQVLNLAPANSCSEREWAALARQQSPLRWRLKTATKRDLLKVATNWDLLFPPVRSLAGSLQTWYFALVDPCPSAKLRRSARNCC